MSKETGVTDPKVRKLVVFVSGGNVQGIYSSSPIDEIVMVDFDNLEAEGMSSDERDSFLQENIKDVDMVY